MVTPEDYAHAHAARFRQELFELLRIPSVSTGSKHAEDLLRAAHWLAEHLRRIGLDSELLSTQRHPLVYGERKTTAEGAATVLVYGHYDVEPAAVEDGRTSEPFTPIEREGKIWARGATDDKGQLFALLKGIESILETRGDLPVNLKVMIEGEEESGSESLATLLERDHEKLSADVCVIADSAMEEIESPAIVYALRGVSVMSLKVHGPATALHSGRFGGSVHNPAQALAEILARLHDADGRVAVPGFCDGIPALAEKERAVIAGDAWSLEQWSEQTGSPKPWGEQEYTLRERVTARPSLEIVGMAGGCVEEGIEASIPPIARATLFCRLVTDQDPEHVWECTRRYVEAPTPQTVRSELAYMGGAPAVVMDRGCPAMQAARRAYERGWGRSPRFVREGGSIPIVSAIRTALKMPVVLMSFGLRSDNLHAPNEHLSVEMFRRGVDTAIALFDELARSD